MNHTVSTLARIGLDTAIPFVSILTVVGIASLASNLILVLLIIKSSKLRKSYNVFILHGAVADLAITIASVPFWILTTIYNEGKAINELTCKVNASLTFIDFVAPTLFLVLTTGHMHCNLVDPKHCRKIFTLPLSYLMILLAWLVAVLLCLPPNLAWQVNAQKQCFPDLTSNVWYTTYVLILFYFFPSCVAISAHVYDITYFRPGHSENIGSVFKNCRKTAMQPEEMDAQKAVFVLVLLQTICWLPFVIVSIVQTGSLSVSGLSANFIALTAGHSSTALKGWWYCVQHPQIWNSLSFRGKCGTSDSSDTEENHEMRQI